MDPDNDLPYKNLENIFLQSSNRKYIPMALKAIERVAYQYPEKYLPAVYLTKFKEMENCCNCSIM